MAELARLAEAARRITYMSIEDRKRRLAEIATEDIRDSKGTPRRADNIAAIQELNRMEQIGTPRQPQSTTTNAQFNLILPNASARGAVDMLLSGIRGALPAAREVEGQVAAIEQPAAEALPGPVIEEAEAEVALSAPSQAVVVPARTLEAEVSPATPAADSLVGEPTLAALPQAEETEAEDVKATEADGEADRHRAQLRAVYDKAFPRS